MNIFDALGKIVQSTTNVFVTTATTMDKAVQLVEREVDNLTIEQEIRMDVITAKRSDLQAQREHKLKEAA